MTPSILNSSQRHTEPVRQQGFMIGHWWNGVGPAQPSPKRHARLHKNTILQLQNSKLGNVYFLM
ncbi:hypothetical protein TcasGA2_TC033741 [Tribolium castaneum]|uniref:Uncharacterized protein n=1 Tax=Tribolium castaneum TaxID=7070 RepID=A0A139WEZ0_TRICA|nr:hypothetical protein TcasGA2_TC033741 [Tribolium castaneum]